MDTQYITMEHGSGGQATGDLIAEIFAAAFNNEILGQMEDSAVVPGPSSVGNRPAQGEPGRLAVTTDSFVVTPLEFRGGDIGRLCVCGTVNDLLMRGAVPKYLTCGFILEEGLEIEVLRRVVKSMARTASEAGIQIVAGDTKVVEAHSEGASGMYINTAGIGFVPDGLNISAADSGPGDAILVSGTMGDHHAAILSERLQIETDIESDCAPLGDMVRNLLQGGIHVHALRDVTRGGLGTVLKELAQASKTCFVIEEEAVPVTPKVRDFCGLLGLDPLYMGNEGKLVATVPQQEADRAVQILRASRYGAEAAVIGQVTGGEAGCTDPGYKSNDRSNDRSYDKPDDKADVKSETIRADGAEQTKRAAFPDAGELYMRTGIGGLRRMDVLHGEGLPRIC